jgi:tetratricopeptide (TPR) repeat protein
MPTRTEPAPATMPPPPADAPSAAARARSVLAGLGVWGLVLALIGLNAWWWSIDRAPPESMATIEGWIRMNRDDEAERALRTILRRSPSHGEARMALARLLGKREDYLGCARELHEVPDWWPTKPDALFLEGQAYKLAHRARNAEAAWAACLDDDPLHPKPLRLIYSASREVVGIYILQMRLDEARAALMATHDLADPADRPGILVLRMEAELNRIHPDEAVKSLRQHIRADPDDWQSRRALAQELQLTGDDDGADRHILACLDARPDDPDAWRTLLEILHQRGDRDRFQQSVARLPDSLDADPELWKYRGLARAWDDDLEGASDAFAEAVRLAPFEPEYHYRLAINEGRLGNRERAELHRGRHEELKEAQGLLREALDTYLDAADELTPDDPEFRAAVERLAVLCEELGWRREAEAWRAILPPRPPDAPLAD